jgi:diguanylate cyclase (GGDEF)-like protein
MPLPFAILRSIARSRFFVAKYTRMRALSLVVALGGASLTLAGAVSFDQALQRTRTRQWLEPPEQNTLALCGEVGLASPAQPAPPTSLPGWQHFAPDYSQPCPSTPWRFSPLTGGGANPMALLSGLEMAPRAASQPIAPIRAPSPPVEPASTAQAGPLGSHSQGVAAGETLLRQLMSGEEPAGRHHNEGVNLARQLDSILLAALMLLGLSLSAALAVLNEQRSLRQQSLLADLRTDGQTDLPSLQSLERDLEDLGKEEHQPDISSALLVTINFHVLERQRAFLTDAQVGETLRQTWTTIRLHRLDWSDLRCYRISDHRLAILSGSVPEPQLSVSAEACDRILRAILADATEATSKTLNLALHWDDIVVTGQNLISPLETGRLLTHHAFGERLAGQDQIAYRMVEANDEQRGRVDTEISSSLIQLSANDIAFRYQPILLLSDPGRFGLELLLRFQPKPLARVGTSNALRFAHDLGIAHKIDEMVISQLQSVQEWLRRDSKLATKIAYVSVNISSDSLATPKRLDHLVELLRMHEIDNGLFCLEITETAATHQLPGSSHVQTASERLIKELAFRIFIDDFGSGLSNYRRICEAWYDTIKLDIGLIKGISDSFRLQHYVGPFIKTVHALGKTIIAEGIEDANDLRTAVRLGADCLQGFRISKPLDCSSLVDFLTTSDWANPGWMEGYLEEIRDSDRLLSSHWRVDESQAMTPPRIPLERLLLQNWSKLRSYEEFVLLFVNELRLWGLDLMRLSLAFLPEEEDIDCSQYVWNSREPGEVRTLRMERDFLEHHEHRSSPLHRIATTGETLRRRLNHISDPDFELLSALKQQGCTDYLGIPLESRGISIPVLTIALQRQCVFSDDQVKRIESMSSLLSLLFYTFESERAKRMALLDPLTGLANRRSYDSFLRANFASCRINQQPLALALIDIDRFKSVNDLMGHAYGDRALRKVAAILGGKLQKRSDFLARLGGEEFGLIMPYTDAQRAQELGAAMRQAIESAEIDHPRAVTGGVLTISIGIGLWTPRDCDSCDSDSLQQLADDCLYAAKNAGRNRVEMASLRERDQHSRPSP